MVIKLEKIDKYTWKIPEDSYKGMRVPVIIYAEENLLAKMKGDQTLLQAAQVATLPGVMKSVFVMPDGHQGYGFPIGGVAAFDVEEGVISPGGVGYDINCLPPGTKVLTPLGYRISIESLVRGGNVVAVDREKGVLKETEVALFLCRPEERLYVVRTRSGHVLKLSSDHPILVRGKGMVRAEELEEGMKVALYPFEGVDYEEPEEFTILNGEGLPHSVRRELRRRGLLPLPSTNPKLTYLLKLLGYVIGNGTIKGEQLQLYGKRENIEEMERDLERLGYTASIYLRKRRAGKLAFNHEEYQLKISARSLVELLYELGYPRGKRPETRYRIPRFIFRLPLWMKRLFLAAYFGAELSKPKTIDGYNFYIPELKVVKVRELSENGRELLEDLKRLLEEFGVRSAVRKTYEAEDRVCWKLLVETSPENLVKLYSRVGYEYDIEGRRLALAAVIYLRLKMRIGEERKILRKVVREEHAEGTPIVVLAGAYGVVDKGFIERSLYEVVEGAQTLVDVTTFEDFIAESVEGDIVYDEIEELNVERYGGLVYDITVVDESHSFVAEGFVVSNCGVRLIRTNLTYDDLKPHLKKLINVIARNVPAGLGMRAKLRFSISELNEVLKRGLEWAYDRGFAWKEDIEHTEEKGRMVHANPDKVSSRAKQRGAPQLGSLGSGNHFLEIQVVDQIFNPSIAKSLGLWEGQITIMVHTGSRGLGHQVASDYLLKMERSMRKYGIKPPSRELACLPFRTPEAQDYFEAMSCAVNYAFTNRQLITHWIRESFKEVFHKDPESFDLSLIYDVAHNIAKIEEHDVNGKRMKLIVHRKGATRAFPPGHPEIPADHRNLGQIVLIPGSMGTASYVLAGVKGNPAWYSTAHGAGRLMSRSAAIRAFRPSNIIKEMSAKGILVVAATRRVLAEEYDKAYKSVDMVAKVSHEVGLARLVVRLRPIGVVKG